MTEIVRGAYLATSMDKQWLFITQKLMQTNEEHIHILERASEEREQKANKTKNEDKKKKEPEKEGKRKEQNKKTKKKKEKEKKYNSRK